MQVRVDDRLLRHRAGDDLPPSAKSQKLGGTSSSSSSRSGRFSHWTSLSAKDMIQKIRKFTFRDWARLTGLVFGLLALGYLIFCLIDGEALFVVYNHRAWELPVAWNYWFNRDMFVQTLKRGRLPGVDHIFISHYAAARERKVHLTEALASFGIDNYSFRDDWTRSRVLREKELVAKRHFADAVRLKSGGKILEANLGGPNVRVWEASGAKEIPVDEPLLGRVANFMQHSSMWQEMIDRNMSSILVLEDDAVFHPAFRYEFQLAMQELPKDYDILFVGGCKNRRAPRDNSYEITPRIHLVRQHRCANGYVLSRNAAIKMLSHPAPLALRNIDPHLELLMNSVIPASYWTEPPLVYEATKAFIPSYRSERATCWFMCSKPQNQRLTPAPSPPPAAGNEGQRQRPSSP